LQKRRLIGGVFLWCIGEILGLYIKVSVVDEADAAAQRDGAVDELLLRLRGIAQYAEMDAVIDGDDLFSGEGGHARGLGGEELVLHAGNGRTVKEHFLRRKIQSQICTLAAKVAVNGRILLAFGEDAAMHLLHEETLEIPVAEKGIEQDAALGDAAKDYVLPVLEKELRRDPVQLPGEAAGDMQGDACLLPK